MQQSQGAIRTGITAVANILLSHDILVLTNGCASFPLLKLGYCTTGALEKQARDCVLLLGPLNLPPVLHMGECLYNARASGLFRALADLSGQPIKAMPFAFSSPEWSQRKRRWGSAQLPPSGCSTLYHCIGAPVSGSANVQRFLEDECRRFLAAAWS